MSIEKILELLDVRSNLLKTDEKNERINEIEKEITEQLKTKYNSYSVDFILETLTEFGQAPNLVYDDNGMFAVSSMGYQPVVTDDERIEGIVSVFVEKQQWFDTIRKALWHYLQY
jgi:hypothetical protein